MMRVTALAGSIAGEIVSPDILQTAAAATGGPQH